MKKLSLGVFCAAICMLPACSLDWPFSQKEHYTITGASEDADLDNYLGIILKDRLETKIEETKDEALNERRETYREQQIKTDLVRAMEAKGYYDGKVKYSDNTGEKFTGEYQVEPGVKYTISSVKVSPNSFSQHLRGRHIQPGSTLDALNVLTEQKKIQDRIAKGRCYFSLKVDNAVILDRQKHTGSLTYNVTAGPEGNFGRVTFTGQKNVHLSYLEKLVPWKEGDCYQSSKVETLKTSLLESGLFSGADIILPKAPEADGTVPLAINLTERAARTVKAGASYYSDEGLGILLGWEHRNFLGEAEKLAIDLNLSSLKQSLAAKLTKPFFLRKDQDLSLNADLRRQDTDAFEEVGIGLGADITRKFTEYLSGTGGVAFNLSQITDKTDPEESEDLYALVSTPFSLTYDNRNNKLDPTKGWLLTGSVEPFWDALGESDPFLKSQLGGSTYFAFDRRARYVLAVRAGVGSILGSEAVNIPPTERFYAGGGGSVRGYGYQEVGPKNDNGDPSGGRSSITASTEFRVKFTDKIGGVAFVDAGSVSDKIFPELSNLAIGAGVGARYYTGFGPLRFDIAVPLTQKEDLDQNYQFYISIGQAF